MCKSDGFQKLSYVPEFGLFCFLKPFFHAELINIDCDCCGYWVAHIEKWFGDSCSLGFGVFCILWVSF